MWKYLNAFSFVNVCVSVPLMGFLTPFGACLSNHVFMLWWVLSHRLCLWLYLSWCTDQIVSSLFSGASLPTSVTLVVQWTDVTQLEKNATLLFPESIRVSTRDTEHYFSMFLNINDTFKLMEQLANIAMRQLLDNEGFAADLSLPKPCKNLKNVSALKRWSSVVFFCQLLWHFLAV